MRLSEYQYAGKSNVNGKLEKIIFYNTPMPEMTEELQKYLATEITGYFLDTDTPFVVEPVGTDNADKKWCDGLSKEEVESELVKALTNFLSELKLD